MKRCPECNRTYADETITFCLADGALLSAPYQPETTQRIPLPRNTNAPTEVLPNNFSHPQLVRRTNRNIIVPLFVALAVALLGVVVMLLMSRNQKENNQTVKTESVSTTPNTQTRESPTTNASASLPQPKPISTMPSSLPLDALIGRWQGQWTSPDGFLYFADMHLEKGESSDNVQGFINWKLQRSPREDLQAKIGLTAVEFLRGKYNSETRTLTMEGYRKSDPNEIISVDKYRLLLSNDGKSLGGATWNHGNWKGRLSLNR